ncbi:MAG: DUF2845 domain-containing protein [Deltaproteobacteria bacterium]|nr:DUF2845 domain-containing protein [Deltaproteobacteria bacterium]
MKTLISVFGLAGLILGATEASAAMSSMRCGAGLVENGMTKPDIISKCGQPDSKEFVASKKIGVDVGGAFRASKSKVEAWRYNCGEGRFNKTLYFSGGKLAVIESSSSRGSGPQKCDN